MEKNEEEEFWYLAIEWRNSPTPESMAFDAKRLEDFVAQAESRGAEKERARILEALDNAPPESTTMGWDAFEGDFIRALLSRTEE